MGLAAAPGPQVPQLARLVRAREATVLRWLTRDLAEGSAGVQAAPRPGRPAEITTASRAGWLAAGRRRPRRLHLPFSWWTLPRLADDLAERTGLRVCEATVRRALQEEGLVLSRPQPRISRPAPDYAVNKRRVKRPATS